MKRLIPTLLVALATSVPAQVITTLKSYRFNVEQLVPPVHLVQGEDGAFYGMNNGALYRWQPDGSGFTILKQLAATDPDRFSGRPALSGNTLFGATSTGVGAGGSVGTVFRMNTDGTSYTVLKTGIPVPPAVEPPGIVLSGETLYGWGFKINNDGTGYTELAGFPDADGLQDWHLDIQVSGAGIFGATARDGQYGAGTIFRLNRDGTGYTVLVDIPTEDQSNINDYLTLVGDTLYGTSFPSQGNAKVFKVNTDGTGYSVLKDDFSTSGEYLSARRLEHLGGVLYGTTTSFISNHVSSAVFKMNTDGTSYTVLKRLTESEPLPNQGNRGLNIFTVAGGAIYGLAQSPSGFEGSPSGLDGRGGALFRMNTDGSGFAVLHEFMVPELFPDGYGPGPLTVSEGVLYGSDFTGSGNKNRVFKMNPDGTGYTPLRVFEPVPFLFPSILLSVSGSTVFGVGPGRGALDGGDYSNARVFRMNTDGTGYTVLKEFTRLADSGDMPSAGLVISGSTLYGTLNAGRTLDGNPSDGGKIFKLNTDGTGYTALHTLPLTSLDPVAAVWTNSDGLMGTHQVELTLSGNTLYGTAFGGGQFGYGTVFKLNTDSTGFTVLKHSTLQQAPHPGPRLTLSGDTLYGTSSPDSDTATGTVFRVNTDGTGFMVVKQFSDPVWDPISMSYTNSDGRSPLPGLALWGNTLYGTTKGGGHFGAGTLFKVNTDGTGFAVIAHNSYSDQPDPGQHALQRLVLSGSTLYGSAPGGGIYSISLEPTLSIGRTGPNSLAVSWPSVWSDYVLQQNPNGLSSVNWSNVTDTIQDDGTNKTLIVNPTGGNRFFRLIQP